MVSALDRFVAFAAAAALSAASSAQAAPPAAGTSARSADPRDRIVCRRFVRTGSLVDSYRTCKTNREWQREHENLQQLSVSNSCRDQSGMGCVPP